MKKTALLSFALAAAVAVNVPLTTFADSDEGYKADNTKMNKVEKERKTAQSQKTTAADRKISAHVRRTIVKDKSLSTYAHNVKVITHNGMVTLKGPVRSEEEKQTVEKLARQAAGDNVTNELTVVPDTDKKH